MSRLADGTEYSKEFVNGSPVYTIQNHSDRNAIGRQLDASNFDALLAGRSWSPYQAPASGLNLTGGLSSVPQVQQLATPSWSMTEAYNRGWDPTSMDIGWDKYLNSKGVNQSTGDDWDAHIDNAVLTTGYTPKDTNQLATDVLKTTPNIGSYLGPDQEQIAERMHAMDSLGLPSTGSGGGTAATPASVAGTTAVTGAGAGAATGTVNGISGLVAPAASIVGGVVSAVGSKVAADAVANAEKEAADTIVRGTKDAAQLQNDQYTQTRKDWAPWRDAGETALGKLGTFETDNPAFGMSQFQQDPGYSFRLSEGVKALQNSAAARGGLLSGNTLKGVQDYGQQAASQEYNNAFNRYQTERGQRLNHLQSLAGVGQTAVQQVGQAGQNYANQAGSAYISGANAMAQGQTGAANANASGWMGGANALNNAISGGINYMQGQDMVNALRGGR